MHTHLCHYNFYRGVRKYWSRWNKCWETTFGFQTTQGSESWHWSIKGPLHGKVLRANELPQYLYDVFMKKESRRIKKIYTLEEPKGLSKPSSRELDQQLYNVFGGCRNKNISTICSVFSAAGYFSFFFLHILPCIYTLYSLSVHRTTCLYVVHTKWTVYSLITY